MEATISDVCSIIEALAKDLFEELRREDGLRGSVIGVRFQYLHSLLKRKLSILRHPNVEAILLVVELDALGQMPDKPLLVVIQHQA